MWQTMNHKWINNSDTFKFGSVYDDDTSNGKMFFDFGDLDELADLVITKLFYYN
jgi:hypothetical protein